MAFQFIKWRGTVNTLRWYFFSYSVFGLLLTVTLSVVEGLGTHRVGIDSARPDKTVLQLNLTFGFEFIYLTYIQAAYSTINRHHLSGHPTAFVAK